MKKILMILSIVIIGTCSTLTMASPHITVINNDKDHRYGDDLEIDYTICDNNNNGSGCTEHKKMSIWVNSPESISLNNENQILNIWKVSFYNASGYEITTNYSKQMTKSDPTQTTSDCHSTAEQAIILNTYDTSSMICQTAVTGQSTSL